VKQEPAEPRQPADAISGRSDGRPAIAVLPFANMSGDPMQEYLSDGITEDIITSLSRWHRLAVQSRSASFRYRGAAVDLGRVARELSVRYIVEGSVRRLGERIRISAQLIDTETGSHVWASVSTASADVFVQDEVVRTIVSTLVGRVQVADAERARRKPPASLAAYECVLHGNALPWSDPRSAAEATRLFEQAIEIDPGYGLAYALLAVMRYIDGLMT
jgi:TolB-like protein